MASHTYTTNKQYINRGVISAAEYLSDGEVVELDALAQVQSTQIREVAVVRETSGREDGAVAEGELSEVRAARQEAADRMVRDREPVELRQNYTLFFLRTRRERDSQRRCACVVLYMQYTTCSTSSSQSLPHHSHYELSRTCQLRALFQKSSVRVLSPEQLFAIWCRETSVTPSP